MSVPRALVCLLVFLPLLAHASEPVDTNQFGFISNGMSEAAVIQRLGEPDEVREEPRLLVQVSPPGQPKVLREKRRYTFVYPGNQQIMDTYIRFEDGVVVGKVKTPH